MSMGIDGQQILNRTGSIVALLITLFLGISIGALLFRDAPSANQNVLLVLLGALATNVTNIVQYFFGNSAGNRAKDSTISTLSNAAATTAVTALGVQTAINSAAAADASKTTNPLA